MFLAWRFGAGEDPYRLYNGLGPDYRPVGRPDLPPQPPRYPSRQRAFIYACAAYAAEVEQQRAKAASGARA